MIRECQVAALVLDAELMLEKQDLQIARLVIDEGRALISEINAHSTQAQYLYVHRWQPRDFVMWDNRQGMHKATDFDWINDVRTMRRTTTVGERI